ncbi:heterokaryon incompatibility protein (HET) domain-containing protein [Diaporthe eres]|nr:heterokaryon incompatibility protein (HET) domain-containing protein [Diaporthe eres]
MDAPRHTPLFEETVTHVLGGRWGSWACSLPLNLRVPSYRENNKKEPVPSMSDTMTSPDSPEGNTSNQPPATADVSHYDLMDIFQRRRDTRVIGEIEPHRNDNKYSRDILSDRDLERFTISPKSDTEDNQRVHAKATEGQHGRLDQYKHHGNVKRFDPFGPSAPRDAEWFVTDPEILSEDDPAYLCEICRHLDFAALFTKRGIQGDKAPSMPMQIRIDDLWRVLREDGNSCAFCGLLRRRIVEGGRISHLSDDDSRGNDMRLYISVLDEGSGYAPRLEVELAWEERIIERFVVHRVREKPQQPLAGRLVQQDRADMDSLRQWLQVCEGSHPSLDKGLNLGLASLRVIDTEELRVREVEMPCRYACLSYVWGKGRQTQYTTATRESLEAPRALQGVDLPQTIQDAIKVTIEAGLQYLWVDALCILQDDPTDKVKIISKMGPIYGGATLTIIASTNTDPHEGLPGMGTAHRCVAQDTATIHGLKLAVGLHDPRQPIPDIDGSVWSSRAWTFQERALSGRSVYFTRSQMVFKCVHCAIMLEETVPAPDLAFRHLPVQDHAQRDLIVMLWSHPSLSRFNHIGFSTGGPGGHIMLSGATDMKDSDWSKMSLEERREIAPVFDLQVEAPRDFMGSIGDTDGGSTPWDMYRRAVEDYTKRKLTWESDAVNAFSGVEHIVRRGMNTKFWFGLPSFAFEQALLWHAKEPLELRTQSNKTIFPSWSWVGWRGQVSYRGRGWKNSVLWDPVAMVRWHVRHDKQQVIDRFKAGEERTEEEIEAFMKQISKAAMILRELNLRHVKTTGKDGWVVKHDEEYNRHIYSHDAYPGVKFTYPVDLPGKIIEDLPDMNAVPNGVLRFMARVVPIIPCDMKETTFKMKIEDRFFQLGINDESRSSNYRPPWQRIVYHQGYRAGFLTLNNSECLPAKGDGCEYHLAAIMLASLPHVPPPPRGWNNYWGIEPRQMQHIMFDEEWRLGPCKVFAAKETAEPSTRAQNEDGNPYWDPGRFNGTAIFDVYEVLLLMTVKGVSWRLGAGRISYSAFWAARPQDMLVQLA